MHRNLKVLLLRLGNNQTHVSSRPIKPRNISIIIITTRRKLPKIFPTTIRRSMMIMSHDNSHIRLMQNIFPRLMHLYIPSISFHNLQHSTDIFSSFGVNFIRIFRGGGGKGEKFGQKQRFGECSMLESLVDKLEMGKRKKSCGQGLHTHHTTASNSNKPHSLKKAHRASCAASKAALTLGSTPCSGFSEAWRSMRL